MSLRNKLGKGIVYLQLLASILGCQNREAAPFGFNGAEPKLESRLEIQPPYYSNKVEEAREDIEKILASDYMKWLKQDSELTFDYITPLKNSKGLYLFRYTYGDKTTINYYCQKNNNKFGRYARKIVVEISAEPYFVEVSFFGDENEGVNPDKQMRALMRRYKIETKDGIKPEYRGNIQPKPKII